MCSGVVESCDYHVVLLISNCKCPAQPRFFLSKVALGPHPDLAEAVAGQAERLRVGVVVLFLLRPF